ncbi:molybdopterin-dependent oxidoreductase [Sedimentitalea todarodis]|uniref:Molybdopterin-dependent oxidoreductase n=1 Tax=Sedimentitalea todarodis TaxID=1631240 RepID=A0ABU3VDE2_9RHOB|nr:molybdopterin-dependent oxidoreductase [Sedimentitalea todarodis]MDU9004197.1 molybdopterin-dependent oxidoreductase [Sedimentitalea todarodis]
MIQKFWKTVVASLVGVIIATAGANATKLGKAEGAVLLTVTGAVTQANFGDAVQFDLAMLEAFDSTVIETTTNWTKGVQRFRGVSLAVLIDALGIRSGTLRAAAINDYTVEIPVTDAVKGGPIVAFELNGKPMSRRNKGPLWIIYPYDSNEAYKSELIYTRSIWQLDRIEAVH